MFSTKDGTACACLPLNIVFFGISLFLFVTNLVQLFAWFIHGVKNITKLDTPTFAPSCTGLTHLSYYTRSWIESFLSAFFGFVGVLGVLERDTVKLSWLQIYFVFLAAFRLFVVLGDTIFSYNCVEYPYNVVAMGLLWGPTYNLPISEGRKAELRELSEFPKDKVDAIVHGVFTLQVYYAVNFIFFFFSFIWYEYSEYIRQDFILRVVMAL